MTDRELDALVAEKVMGLLGVFFAPAIDDEFKPIMAPAYRPNKNATRRVLPYSSDISAAWQVVEKMKADGYTLELDDRRAGWAACFVNYKCGDSKIIAKLQARIEIDKSAPRVLCLAALKALGVEAGKEGR